MKKRNLLVGIIIATLVLTGCGKKASLDENKNILKLGDDKITATNYYDEIKENNISVLINLMDHKLLDEAYKTTDEEKKKIKDQIKQIKDNYGSNEETFKTILQQYFGVDSEEELENVLSIEYKRNQAVEDYLKEHLNDNEIKKYYDKNIYGEIKASHILIMPDVSDSATTQEKEEANKIALEEAKEVIKKLKNGEKFADLAKEYSDDTATKDKGGDLGFFQPDDMVEEFKNAAVELKVGKYTTTPVKTKYGYHIILKVEEKEKTSLDEVKDNIKTKLAQDKLDNDSTLYYKTLMDYRESKGLVWEDDTLKKRYNEYMKTLINNSKN